MKHTIEVNNIKIYAFHGCLPEEEKIGGQYTVDVMLNTDFTHASQHDTLVDTIDYVVINHIVNEEMMIRSKLIEHVAHRIHSRLKNKFKTISYLRIKVTKICPPINGDVGNVCVIIEE